MSMDRSQRFWEQSRGRRRNERRDSSQKSLQKKKGQGCEERQQKKSSLATNNIVRATAANIWENLTDKDMSVIKGMHDKLSNSSQLGVVEIIKSVTDVVQSVCGLDMVNETFYLINENKSHAAYQLAIELIGIYKNKNDPPKTKSRKELQSKSSAGMENRPEEGPTLLTNSDAKLEEESPKKRISKGGSSKSLKRAEPSARKRNSRSPEYLSCLDLPVEPSLSTKTNTSPGLTQELDNASIASNQKVHNDLAVFTLLTDIGCVDTTAGSSTVGSSAKTSIASTSTSNGNDDTKRSHKEKIVKMKCIKEQEVTADNPPAEGEVCHRKGYCPRSLRDAPSELIGQTFHLLSSARHRYRNKGGQEDQNCAAVTPIFRAKRENIEKQAQELGVSLEKEGFVTERSLVASLKESIIGKHKVKMYKKKISKIHERLRSEDVTGQKDVRILPVKPPAASKSCTPANSPQERELIPAVMKTPNWTQPSAIARNEALLKKRDILRMKNSERNDLIQKQFLKLRPIRGLDATEKEMKKNPAGHGRKAKVKIRPVSAGVETSESLATEEVIQLIRENAPSELGPFLEIIKCYNNIKKPTNSSFSPTGSSSKLEESMTPADIEVGPHEPTEKHVTWDTPQSVEIGDSAVEFTTSNIEATDDIKQIEKKQKKVKSVEKKLEGSRTRRRKRNMPPGSFEIIAATLLVLGLGAFFVSEAPLLSYFLGPGESSGVFGYITDVLNSLISSVLFPFS